MWEVDPEASDDAAIPWRMTVEAYASVDGGVPVGPQLSTITWVPDLAIALHTRDTAVFEEQVVRSLLDDLRGEKKLPVSVSVETQNESQSRMANIGTRERQSLAQEPDGDNPCSTYQKEKASTEYRHWHWH